MTCLLLDKGGGVQEVTSEIVREHLYEDEKFSEDEIKVVVDISNLLRPYCPKRGADGKLHEHIFVLCPFCLLANHILRALGYSDFTRRLSPLS